MVPYGFLWFPMVSYGFLWFPMASYGFLWFSMVSYGFLWFSYGFLPISAGSVGPFCKIARPPRENHRNISMVPMVSSRSPPDGRVEALTNVLISTGLAGAHKKSGIGGGAFGAAPL